MKVRKAKDLKNLTSFEQTHLPWIVMPEFIKKNEKFYADVKIGEVKHSMEKNHFIRCIRLYINDEQIECKKLRLSDRPEARFRISLEKNSTIKVWAECNIHGMWETEKKIILYIGDSK